MRNILTLADELLRYVTELGRGKSRTLDTADALFLAANEWLSIAVKPSREQYHEWLLYCSIEDIVDASLWFGLRESPDAEGPNSYFCAVDPAFDWRSWEALTEAEQRTRLASTVTDLKRAAHETHEFCVGCGCHVPRRPESNGRELRCAECHAAYVFSNQLKAMMVNTPNTTPQVESSRPYLPPMQQRTYDVIRENQPIKGPDILYELGPNESKNTLEKSLTSLRDLSRIKSTPAGYIILS